MASKAQSDVRHLAAKPSMPIAMPLDAKAPGASTVTGLLLVDDARILISIGAPTQFVIYGRAIEAWSDSRTGGLTLRTTTWDSNQHAVEQHCRINFQDDIAKRLKDKVALDARIALLGTEAQLAEPARPTEAIVQELQALLGIAQKHAQAVAAANVQTMLQASVATTTRINHLYLEPGRNVVVELDPVVLDSNVDPASASIGVDMTWLPGDPRVQSPKWATEVRVQQHDHEFAIVPRQELEPPREPCQTRAIWRGDRPGTKFAAACDIAIVKYNGFVVVDDRELVYLDDDGNINGYATMQGNGVGIVVCDLEAHVVTDTHQLRKFDLEPKVNECDEKPLPKTTCRRKISSITQVESGLFVASRSSTLIQCVLGHEWSDYKDTIDDDDDDYVPFDVMAARLPSAVGVAGIGATDAHVYAAVVLEDATHAGALVEFDIQSRAVRRQVLLFSGARDGVEIGHLCVGTKCVFVAACDAIAVVNIKTFDVLAVLALDEDTTIDGGMATDDGKLMVCISGGWDHATNNAAPTCIHVIDISEFDSPWVE